MSDSEQRRYILTGIAITCSIVGPVTTVYCTKKALEKLEKERPQTAWDKFCTVAPYAIAPATFAIGGAVCSALAYNEGTQAIAAIGGASSAAISAITANVKQYDDIVKEAVGEKKYKEIKNKYLDHVAENPALDRVRSDAAEIAIQKDTNDSLRILGPTQQIIETGHGDILFEEKWSNQQFRSSWDHIRSVVNDCNELINGQNGGYDIVVNDLLRRLGLRPAELGDAYYFPNGIKYMNDCDHLYVKNDTNNEPKGILEFEFGYAPVPANKVLARI